MSYRLVVHERILVLHPDIQGPSGKLDGSAKGMTHFLRELAALAGQPDGEGGNPVFELYFGQVLTRTCVTMGTAAPYLAITAFLPRDQRLAGLSASAEQLGSVALPADSDLLWHADDACYIIARHIPVSDFLDEPSVLDAVMDASIQANTWLSLACAAAPIN